MSTKKATRRPLTRRPLNWLGPTLVALLLIGGAVSFLLVAQRFLRLQDDIERYQAVDMDGANRGASQLRLESLRLQLALSRYGDPYRAFDAKNAYRRLDILYSRFVVVEEELDNYVGTREADVSEIRTDFEVLRNGFLPIEKTIEKFIDAPDTAGYRTVMAGLDRLVKGAVKLSVLANQVLVRNAFALRERMIANMESYQRYLLLLAVGFLLLSMVLYWILQRQTAMRRQIEAALREAEAAQGAKSAFFANMSHELRSPLNAIIGMSEIMKTALFGPMENPKYREYVSDIHLSGVHLHELIGDILDLSAIDSGKTELHVEAVDISLMSKESIRLMSPLAEKGRVRLRSSVGPEVPAILADRRRVRQILLNLLSNAIKFTPEDGEVKLGVSIAASGELALSVSDTGVGMDDDELGSAFERFWQTKRSHTRENEGTGLGLAVTSGLMSAHGGRLELKSTLGQGTTATAYFPPERLLAA